MFVKAEIVNVEKEIHTEQSIEIIKTLGISEGNFNSSQCFLKNHKRIMCVQKIPEATNDNTLFTNVKSILPGLLANVAKIIKET